LLSIKPGEIAGMYKGYEISDVYRNKKRVENIRKQMGKKFYNNRLISTRSI
jgi:hypothetical protein